MNNQDIVANIISSSDYNTALKLLCVTNPSFLSIHKALLELKEKEQEIQYALDNNAPDIWLDKDGYICFLYENNDIDQGCTSCGAILYNVHYVYNRKCIYCQ